MKRLIPVSGRVELRTVESITNRILPASYHCRLGQDVEQLPRLTFRNDIRDDNTAVDGPANQSWLIFDDRHVGSMTMSL